MKSSSNKTLIVFLQKVLFLLHFGSCQNCMSSTNRVTEIDQKLSNKRVLSTGERCTCEYVTLLQSFHRSTLSIHRYIAQNFQPTLSMSTLFRRIFSTAIFSRFSNVAIVTSNFMNKFYHVFFIYINCKLNIGLRVTDNSVFPTSFGHGRFQGNLFSFEKHDWLQKVFI